MEYDVQIRKLVMGHYGLSEQFGFDIDVDDDDEQIADELSKQYEMVDLKLPSGTLWAKWNLGASKDDPYGDYYQWSYTEPVGDPINGAQLDQKYSEHLSAKIVISKYNETDGKTELDLEDDPAYSSDNIWRTPSKADFDELLTNCNHEWGKNHEGVYGMRVTTRRCPDAELFFPAAGECMFDGLYGLDEDMGVWTRTSANYVQAWKMSCGNDPDEKPKLYKCAKTLACAIRPVFYRQ